MDGNAPDLPFAVFERGAAASDSRAVASAVLKARGRPEWEARLAGRLEGGVVSSEVQAPTTIWATWREGGRETNSAACPEIEKPLLAAAREALMKVKESR